MAKFVDVRIYEFSSKKRCWLTIKKKMPEIKVVERGLMEYGEAWAMQEEILAHHLALKAQVFKEEMAQAEAEKQLTNYLILCQHPHVYTLGKSGSAAHLLISDEKLAAINATYYKTNRGGDITYHGPGQLVGYPILDLEQFYTDLGRYMRDLEEVIIRTLALYNIVGSRLPGSTGVWLDGDNPTRARKICAMGVRCSRWVTIHGFALNVNTDLSYFGHIVPCGIVDKGVTSMAQELGGEVDFAGVERILVREFLGVFG